MNIKSMACNCRRCFFIRDIRTTIEELENKILLDESFSDENQKFTIMGMHMLLNLLDTATRHNDDNKDEYDFNNEEYHDIIGWAYRNASMSMKRKEKLCILSESEF